MNTEQLYQHYLQHPLVCTDTRQIQPGCMFFALKGEHFNGNQFAAQALEAGAALAVVDDPSVAADERFILVDDVLMALQNLARYHRRQLPIPFIGITGTNGKTTTKELLYAVLSQRFKTQATQGNLNNHIGVPLTILSLSAQTEMAIIEMGANHIKEIEFLCSIAQPTHGLITNVGKAHLEGFGSFEGVKATKGELYEYLSKTEGVAFINSDNHFLVAMSREREVEREVFYGISAGNFVCGKLQKTAPYLEVAWHRQGMEFDDSPHIAQSNLTGTYNVENILAAICLGSYFGLSPEEINQGITSYQPRNNRSQLTQTASNTLICDYYNANPSSMAVALENLEMAEASKKVLILGDMFELGSESETEHQVIVEKAEALPADQHIFIGAEFYKFRNNAGSFYRDTQEAYQALKEKPIKDSLILIKGSRGMKLETLVELL